MAEQLLYRLGTRRSQLATTQSETIRQALLSLGLPCELVFIDSEGDKNTSVPLYQMETEPGLFTKQLELALIENKIDLAVHSLKDLPTQQPDGLRVGAVSKREVSDDCLLIHPDHVDPTLPLTLRKGAKVGTSSLRREAELLSLRADLNIVPIRGNVPTRVKAVRDAKFDAVVLAKAGLSRLNADLGGVVEVPLPREHFIPAPGQGALAIEVRDDCPEDLLKALQSLHDAKAETQTRIERKILRDLEGGCTLPLGVTCETKGDEYVVSAFLGLLKDSATERREWLSFHHFDISEADENVIVFKTVSFFKEVIRAAK